MSFPFRVGTTTTTNMGRGSSRAPFVDTHLALHAVWWSGKGTETIQFLDNFGLIRVYLREVDERNQPSSPAHVVRLVIHDWRLDRVWVPSLDTLEVADSNVNNAFLEPTM